MTLLPRRCRGATSAAFGARPCLPSFAPSEMHDGFWGNQTFTACQVRSKQVGHPASQVPTFHTVEIVPDIRCPHRRQAIQIPNTPHHSIRTCRRHPQLPRLSNLLAPLCQAKRPSRMDARRMMPTRPTTCPRELQTLVLPERLLTIACPSGSTCDPTRSALISGKSASKRDSTVTSNCKSDLAPTNYIGVSVPLVCRATRS